MFQIKIFNCNPFQENTYLLYNENRNCVIIDPGMYNASEQILFENFLKENDLTPKVLINTHCHIDHVFSNQYCVEKYGLELGIHQEDLQVLQAAEFSARSYQLNYNPSPNPAYYIEPLSEIKLDNDVLKVLFTPGHSPGSISFYCEKQHFCIVGDALFFQSIGRTDFPGGHHQTLIDSIKTQLFSLPDNTIVHSGHGAQTTIGHEKQFNPFLND